MIDRITWTFKEGFVIDTRHDQKIAFENQKQDVFE